MFNVVLVEPEIPPNTGNVGRLCLATGSVLHLVKPLGFSTDDRALRRAGLDYWAHVQVRYWASLDEFLEKTSATARTWFFTTKARARYWSVSYQPGDYLVFGRETRGLPESLLRNRAEQACCIPLRPEARSLNLATAVAIVLFEAVRQTERDS
ncbi:MAG TPA: tRNA (uridine(34)/cytosine(34)/5-carboxymethylaminomethyluridine(34)-2'-O)-methyltransferase TrmL [Chthoniobacterales bacterium]